MSNRRLLASLVLLAVARVATAAAPQGSPEISAPAVVLAVDVSRSLAPDELAHTTALLRRVVETSPAGTRWGVLTFADEPHWVVAPGADAAAAAAALDGLRPEGRYTLLDDALFAAARALDGGGVVLLASDGRDENSATTVEDVAARCLARGVRIVGVSTGRTVDTRALRRLAMLTDGVHAGAAADAKPEALAATVAEQLAAVASTPRPGAAAPPTPAAAAEAADGATAAPGGEVPGTTAPPAGTAPQPAASGTHAPAPAAASHDLWPWVAGLAVLALAILLGVAIARRRPVEDAASGQGLQLSYEPPTRCPQCGAELAPGATCERCAERRRDEALRARPTAPPAQAREVRVETAVFQVPFEERIEKTFVMTEQHVLDVKQPGESRRSYLLPGETAFAVGRVSESNTLTIHDPTLSSHHFRIVPDGGSWYLLDDHSTNGTYVNGERTRLRPLRSGDQILAGQVEFTFRVQQEPLR